MVSSGPIFYSNDGTKPTVTATGKMLVSGISESVQNKEMSKVTLSA
jgi:hypothetical protein